MTILVKICGMTASNAVDAAIDAGADALGFVFYEQSPRNLAPEEAVRLAASIPRNVKKVAVMLHPSAALWERVQKNFRPQVLQTDVEDFSYLNVKTDIEKWPVLRESSMPKCVPEKFVYEGKRSGYGEVVDWNVAAKLARRSQMILAGGLSTENVQEAIQLVSPFGVDVSSAVESRPGVKDVDKIRAFVAGAKTA